MRIEPLVLLSMAVDLKMNNWRYGWCNPKAEGDVKVTKGFNTAKLCFCTYHIKKNQCLRGRFFTIPPLVSLILCMVINAFLSIFSTSLMSRFISSLVITVKIISVET